MVLGARGGGSAGLLALALALSACEKAPPASVQASVEDAAVAARVDDQVIYVDEVRLEAEAQGLAGGGKDLEPDSAEFNRILDQLIDVKLLAMEARKRRLEEDPQSRHRLQAAQEHILGNILMETVVSERVDEAAIRKMYEAQIAIWDLGEEARLRHIVVATRPEIDAVTAQLARGMDFAVLASRVSIDETTRLEGGDLGFMKEEDAAPELAAVIRSTPAGGLSRPFQTEEGWHVVKVEERRKEQPPTLEELREPILKHLTMVQIGEVLKELRTQAKIKKLTSPQNSSIDASDPFDLAPEEKPKTPLAGFESASPYLETGDAPASPSAPAAPPSGDAAAPAAAREETTRP
jgi:peptidyl-prolyl cis-trans isomerase C